MKFFELIYYITFILAASLKCFAVSKMDIQLITAEYLVYSGILYLLFNYKYIVSKKIGILLLLYGITVSVSAIFAKEYITTLLFVNSILFPVLFLVSFVFFLRNPGVFKYMKYIGIVGIVLGYINLVRLFTEANLHSTRLLQNSAGNTLVAMLPFVFLWKNKIVHYVLLGIIFVGCLVALKRSGFVAFTLVVYAYIVITNHKGLYSRSIVYFGVAIIAIFIAMNYIDGGDVLMARFAKAKDDGGSGRDELINIGLRFFAENDFIQWMFGSGYEGYRRTFLHVVGRRVTCAHNDYVEILYDSGVFAVTLFIAVIVRLCKHVKLCYNLRSPLTASLAAGTLVLLCASMFVCSFIHIWYYQLLYCVLGGIYALTLNNMV